MRARSLTVKVLGMGGYWACCGGCSVLLGRSTGWLEVVGGVQESEVRKVVGINSFVLSFFPATLQLKDRLGRQVRSTRNEVGNQYGQGSKPGEFSVAEKSSSSYWVLLELLSRSQLTSSS